jgi:hypothetical protein
MLRARPQKVATRLQIVQASMAIVQKLVRPTILMLVVTSLHAKLQRRMKLRDLAPVQTRPMALTLVHARQHHHLALRMAENLLLRVLLVTALRNVLEPRALVAMAKGRDLEAR